MPAGHGLFGSASSPEIRRQSVFKIEFAIPPGRHRLTLDNAGGDWACIGWYAFMGETLDR